MSRDRANKQGRNFRLIHSKSVIKTTANMELEQLEKSVEANPEDPSLQFELVTLFPVRLFDMGLVENLLMNKKVWNLI